MSDPTSCSGCDPNLQRALDRLRERIDALGVEIDALEVEINGPRALPSARVGRSSRAGALARMWMWLRS